MRREQLIAYAESFVSFLLDDSIAKDISRLILFGSVARGDFDKESDIDLFIDTKKNIEKEAVKVLNLFNQSETRKKWELKGVENEISLKVGNLDEWKLKRELISDGILLYGKLKESPEKFEHYLLLRPKFKNFKKSKQVSMWRTLYGYKQKVGKKIYETSGLVQTKGGKRINSGILIPSNNKKEISHFLNKSNMNYDVNEIWSDTI